MSRPSHQCSRCVKSYDQKFRLDDHWKAVHNNNPYRCRTCGATYVGRDCFRKHTENKHGAGAKFTCPHCLRAFCKKGDRNRHLRGENGDSCVSTAPRPRPPAVPDFQSRSIPQDATAMISTSSSLDVSNASLGSYDIPAKLPAYLIPRLNLIKALHVLRDQQASQNSPSIVPLIRCFESTRTMLLCRELCMSYGRLCQAHQTFVDHLIYAASSALLQVANIPLGRSASVLKSQLDKILRPVFILQKLKRRAFVICWSMSSSAYSIKSWSQYRLDVVDDLMSSIASAHETNIQEYQRDYLNPPPDVFCLSRSATTLLKTIWCHFILFDTLLTVRMCLLRSNDVCGVGDHYVFESEASGGAERPLSVYEQVRGKRPRRRMETPGKLGDVDVFALPARLYFHVLGEYRCWIGPEYID